MTLTFLYAALPAIMICTIGLPMILVCNLVGKFNKKKGDLMALHIVQRAFLNALRRAGIKVERRGYENVPTDTAVLFVANHRSFIDIPVLYSKTPSLCSFVAKREVEKVPGLRRWMKALYCLFLDRDDMKQGLKTILAAIDYMKAGISVAIFPEGTRNKGENEQELLEFKEGSFKIATKSGCPIVPVAISGTRSTLEGNGKGFHLKKGKVIVTYGEPIYPDKLEAEDKKHIGAYTASKISQLLKENSVY